MEKTYESEEDASELAGEIRQEGRDGDKEEETSEERVEALLEAATSESDEPKEHLAKAHPFRDRFAAHEALVLLLLERITECEKELAMERARTYKLVSDMQGVRKDLVRKNDEGLKRMVDRAMASLQAHMQGHR